VATASVLVIGIGNASRGDDAVGLAVARRVRDRLAGVDGVSVVECAGDAASLVSLWSASPVVLVIDAVRSGDLPGRIHRVDLVASRRPVILRGTSSHAFGLGEAIELARALGGLPPRLVLYGIEAGETGLGAPLSPGVAVASALVTRRVVRAVRQARRGGPPGGLWA
jgi:hydrogenase maturation protease